MTCTFGTNVPVYPNGANTCGRTTQDDQAMLRDALGCRQ